MIQAHPRIDEASQLDVLEGTSVSHGFRMPAEWEPIDAMFVVTPHNEETWPGCFQQARQQHLDWQQAMRQVVEVRDIASMGIQTNDSWIRDFGPIGVVNKCTGQVAYHDFYFNSWGAKYEGERPHDNLVPQEIALRDGTPLWIHNFVLEGGSVEVNGMGTLLTTQQCLFSESRNPWMSPEEIERALCEAFDLHRILWLPGGIAGDDTDGHIDDIARFVAPDCVVCVSAPKGHLDYEVTQKNLAALRAQKNALPGGMNIVELPMPDPIMYDFPTSDHYRGGGMQPLPASYANFVMANGHVFVPVFGKPQDDIACRLIEDASGMKVIPVRSEHLVVGLGSLHCLSQQRPKAPVPAKQNGCGAGCRCV